MTGAAPGLWLDTLHAGQSRPRPALDGDTDADVVIVGAGFTGLWTAYYLRQQLPQRRVLLVEAHHVGAGASGRNGGWCTTEMPALLATLVRRHGPMQAMRFYRAARRTLDEIERVLQHEGIAGGWRRDGAWYVARTPAQVDRLRAWQDLRTALGITDLTLWEAAQLRDRIQIAGAMLAGFTPACAAVNPAAIATGLAKVLEQRGVTIVEKTRAVHIRPSEVRTDRGVVRAPVVLCATEAYTGSLTGHARRVLPVISRALATVPIPPRMWHDIGWVDRATVADSRHQFVYFQRTPDDRLLVGGRGVSYRAGSGTRASRTGDRRVFDRLQTSVGEVFPQFADVAISHRWSGAYGLHRDTAPVVHYDHATGLGHAGGYGGEGIALSNLAGRTLAALISGTASAQTRLFWTDRRVRRWEPEPLRMLGVRAVAALATATDRYEDRFLRTAPLAGRVLRFVL